MKPNKILFLGLAAAMLTGLCGISAAARTGDVAGKYYATDIVTSVNGAEIDAINIGGKTLIKAEALQDYSFGVSWSPEERKLFVTHFPSKEPISPPPVDENPDLKVGTPLGDYYETDIVTVLDGEPITAYNTGGITYILAEEMQRFGYRVVWNPDARTLDITSPDRAGYEYDVFLSAGERPPVPMDDYSQPDSLLNGQGAFSIEWKDGQVTGRGDASLFDSHIHCTGKDYRLTMAFYQNDGGMYAGNLYDVLRSLLSEDRGVILAAPEDLYDRINEVVEISVNGHKAKQVTVTGGGGNGHTDYYFTVEGLPMLRAEEIHEVRFALGDAATLEAYPIVPKSYDAELNDSLYQSLKKSETDYAYSYYALGDSVLVYMRHSPAAGVIEDSLYLGNNATGECRAELLEQVRKYEGFESSVLRPYGYTPGPDGGSILFFCATADTVWQFAVDTATAAVTLISA